MPFFHHVGTGAIRHSSKRSPGRLTNSPSFASQKSGSTDSRNSRPRPPEIILGDSGLVSTSSPSLVTSYAKRTTSFHSSGPSPSGLSNLDKVATPSNPSDGQLSVALPEAFNRISGLAESIRLEVKGIQGSMTQTDEVALKEEKRRLRFNLGIGAVIFLNFIFIALETDFGEKLPLLFSIAENCFCAIFVIELLLRLRWDGWRYFCDLWNLTDFFLVGLSVFDNWIMAVLVSQGHGEDQGEGLQKLTMLRVLRLLRLVRVLRAMRLVRELTLLIVGFANSLRALCWVFVILAMIVCVSAVFLTTMVGKNGFEYDPEVRGRFSSVGRSTYTLFACLTEGCSEHVVFILMEEQPWWGLFFVLFICLTTFGFLNIVVAVFVETTLRAAENDASRRLEERRAHEEFLIDNIRIAFEGMDRDGSGTLSGAEFEEAIRSNTEVKEAMEELEIGNIENLFSKLDVDGSGELSIEEFIRGVVLLQRGNEPAKSGEVLSTMMSVCEVQRQVRDLQSCADEMKAQLQELIAANSKAVMDRQTDWNTSSDLYTEDSSPIKSSLNSMCTDNDGTRKVNKEVSFFESTDLQSMGTGVAALGLANGGETGAREPTDSIANEGFPNTTTGCLAASYRKSL